MASKEHRLLLKWSHFAKISLFLKEPYTESKKPLYTSSMEDARALFPALFSREDELKKLDLQKGPCGRDEGGA